MHLYTVHVSDSNFIHAAPDERLKFYEMDIIIYQLRRQLFYVCHGEKL